VTLRAITDDRASVHALRAVLKLAKRRGLLAVEVRELPSINTQTIRPRSAGRRIVDHTQRRESTIMTISLTKYGPASKWLKLEDFHDKPPRRERIGLVKVEDGKYGERVILVLEPSGQMLSLNKTSVGNLLRDLGENDDDWVGKLVEIFAGEVDGPQGTTDAILVCGVADVPADTAIAAKAAKAAKAKAKSADFNDEIDF
jgi:hypothetical protein